MQQNAFYNVLIKHMREINKKLQKNINLSYKEIETVLNFAYFIHGVPGLILLHQLAYFGNIKHELQFRYFL